MKASCYLFQSVHFNPLVSGEYSFTQCIMDKLLCKKENSYRFYQLQMKNNILSRASNETQWKPTFQHS